MARSLGIETTRERVSLSLSFVRFPARYNKQEFRKRWSPFFCETARLFGKLRPETTFENTRSRSNFPFVSITSVLILFLSRRKSSVSRSKRENSKYRASSIVLKSSKSKSARNFSFYNLLIILTNVYIWFRCTMRRVCVI